MFASEAQGYVNLVCWRDTKNRMKTLLPHCPSISNPSCQRYYAAARLGMPPSLRLASAEKAALRCVPRLLCGMILSQLRTISFSVEFVVASSDVSDERAHVC